MAAQFEPDRLNQPRVAREGANLLGKRRGLALAEREVVASVDARRRTQWSEDSSRAGRRRLESHAWRRRARRTGARNRSGAGSSRIINGASVPVDRQRELGLVTVSTGCSGTLVNQYWVLTADHCVTTDGMAGGPGVSPGSLRITAAWSAAVVTPTRVVRSFVGAGRDVALIFLGNQTFGRVNVQLFFVGPLDTGMTVTKYGRGISVYASGNGPATAVASSGSGPYRTARFTVGEVSSQTYRLPASGNEVGAGGDSGGPDFVTAPNGIHLGIAGVM